MPSLLNTCTQEACVIADGFLAAGPHSLTAEELRERWVRTRSTALNRVLGSPNSTAVGTFGEFFSGIRRAMTRFAGQSREAAAWEFSFTHGQIRRGWLARPAVAVGGTAGVPDSAGRDLRARPIDDIALPADVLVNPVAGYLGRRLNLEVGWETTAPATGSTPNWNGKEVRTLSWSGHSTRFRHSETAALLEGIERRVGALQSSCTVRVARARDLEGRVITPNDFPAYPSRYYGRHGAPYSADEPHEWVVVENLASGESAWIPREYIYYGEQMAYRLWALATSSGCATGSSIDEAKLFGSLELIERDAFIASWYGRIEPVRLDLRDLSELRATFQRAQLLGITLEAGLMESALGVPAVISAATMTSELGDVTSVGAAAHPSLLGAIKGAVKEAWTYIAERARVAETKAERIAQLHANPTDAEGIDDHPLLVVGSRRPEYINLCGTNQPVPVQDLPRTDWERYQHGPPGPLLAQLTERLAAEGIDVWSHVQTSDVERGMGLETVMVVAPKLLPIDFGWDLQRALQAPRLRELIRRHHGTDVEPRQLPHPFS